MKDDRLREKIENLFEHYEWIQFEGSTVLAIHPEEIAEAIEPLIVAELKAVKEESIPFHLYEQSIKGYKELTAENAALQAEIKELREKLKRRGI